MAKATIKYATAVKPPVEKVVLELSRKEAVFLKMLLGHMSRTELQTLQKRYKASLSGRHPDDIATLTMDNVYGLHADLAAHDKSLLTPKKNSW